MSDEPMLQEVQSEQREGAEPSKPRLEPARPQVLVVEDDPAHREYLVELLALWGYTALPVGSAEEADFAIRRHRVFAAVVDVFLPGRSGTALISKLRERFPEAKVVGVSALGDAATARRCKAMGADLFLSKPVTPDALAEALSTQRQTWH
jgi:CheY-like chemotaxis protein